MLNCAMSLKSRLLSRLFEKYSSSEDEYPSHTLKAKCRNCESFDIERIDRGGRLSYFLAYRAYGIILEPEATMTVDTVICRNCNFYSTYRPFLEEELHFLYADYRQESYNKDREVFEPGYTSTWAKRFKDLNEKNRRTSQLSQYIEGKIVNPLKIKKVLDWGGADGSHIPRIFTSAKKYVYEVSNEKPVQQVTKICDGSKLGKYDYIQLGQVLEHLIWPRKELTLVLSHLKKGGYLYLDVPLEVPNKNLYEAVKNKEILLDVHEHINKFTSYSLTRLAESLNLFIIDVTVEKWKTGDGGNIRGLFRRK